MAKKLGSLFIAIGVLCLLSAAGLVVYNSIDEKKSEQSALSLLEGVKEKMTNSTIEEDTQTGMKIIQVEGYESIGVLSIPTLDLELPVLNGWNYQKLKKAPCVYYGSYQEENFVIAAHNYQSHFGRLKDLKEKDVIIFTNANGNSYYYEVVVIETLSKYATEEMVTSGFDLSLYTCTIGGANRVTVRCDRIK